MRRFTTAVLLGLASSACNLPVSPSGAGAVLGDCDLQPNYADSTLTAGGDGAPQLTRWASFPVTYHIDTESIPSHLREVYAESGKVGGDRWRGATNDRIGRVHHVPSMAGAQITLTFAERGAIPLAGSTTITMSGRVITRASIVIQRLTGDDHLLQTGQRARLLARMVGVVAHEFGHALGILLHSPNPADVMYASGNFRENAPIDPPGALITARDRNTLFHAYCR